MKNVSPSATSINLCEDFHNSSSECCMTGIKITLAKKKKTDNMVVAIKPYNGGNLILCDIEQMNQLNK